MSTRDVKVENPPLHSTCSLSVRGTRHEETLGGSTNEDPSEILRSPLLTPSIVHTNRPESGSQRRNLMHAKVERRRGGIIGGQEEEEC